MGAGVSRVCLFAMILLFTTVSIASTNKNLQHCRQVKKRGEIRASLFRSENRLAFINPRGWLDIGLCWWHSRFQRSAAYLMNFHPDRPRPSLLQALYIIETVFEGRDVVDVPGYQNLWQFSRDWEESIVQYLSYKQIEDTAYLNFLRGLRPLYTSARILQTQVERIYHAVTIQDKIQYLALKSPSTFIGTHSWLVAGAIKTTDGYDLEIIDSNSPHPFKVEYKFGDTNLMGYAPYLQRDADYWKIGSALNSYCSGG